mmetsp:Transcript_1735/g.3117  ORF Transcript_1735/g.3117 Transcript_1735/m.3117 type:complete len:84 (-) Transcript_1735:411-662(-)
MVSDSHHNLRRIEAINSLEQLSSISLLKLARPGSVARFTAVGVSSVARHDLFGRRISGYLPAEAAGEPVMNDVVVEKAARFPR